MAHRPMVTAGWVAEPTGAFVSRDGNDRSGGQKENTRREGGKCCRGRPVHLSATTGAAGNVAGHSHKKACPSRVAKLSLELIR